MTHEEHTSKQVQTHTLSRNNDLQKTTRNNLALCLNTAKYFIRNKKIYQLPWIKNDGECSTLDYLKIVFHKAQTPVNYSYVLSEKRFMLFDIQGSMYKLYDPEIATKDLKEKDKDELYLFYGNLSVLAIGTFRKEHICNFVIVTAA